jgi:hypothetical protein
VLVAHLPVSSDRAMTKHLQMARLVKPFPVRRLADGLHQVLGSGNWIHNRLMGVLLDPPATKEGWCQELQAIKGMLMTLEHECREAGVLVDGLFDSADRDYQIGITAVTAMLRGYGFGAEIPVTEGEDEQMGMAA